jgi:hypothetical protein
MTVVRQDVGFDVTGALPPGSADRADVTTTVVFDPEKVQPERPIVVLAVPGGT